MICKYFPPFNSCLFYSVCVGAQVCVVLGFGLRPLQVLYYLSYAPKLLKSIFYEVQFT
jgi:hypothetical protein